jgi:hypothetical protein
MQAPTQRRWTKCHYLIIATALIAVCGCGKKSENATTQSTMDAGTAKSIAKEIPYKEELERGLAKQFNYLPIPRGDIQIMSGLSSQMESANMKAKRFPDKYLEALQACEKEGLLKFTETPQSQLDQIASMGTRKFTVTPTALAVNAADKKLSDHDWIYIPLGTCRVKTVVKDMEYRHPALAASDDFRLVVGTYERSYNDFAKRLGEASKPETFKFRALAKVNPFNQTYSFQIADWGNIAEDAWQSANIPNLKRLTMRCSEPRPHSDA